jgi:signal transduction histidine kinase
VYVFDISVVNSRARIVSRRLSSLLDRAWWIPFAFVGLAVSVLLGTPILVNRAMRALGAVIDEESRARLVLNDLEAAGATEALIARRLLGVPLASRGRDDSAAAAAGVSAEKDEQELDSLLRGSDPRDRDDLATITRLERAWRDRASLPSAAVVDSLSAAADPLALFAAAERLDLRLSQRLDTARERARLLQELNALFAIILTPIAVLSVIAVFWTARRYRGVAHRLEREHAALVESLDTRAALLRGIAHDVKNPLGAAAGYADLLADGLAGPALTAEQLTMVRRIRKLLDDALMTISELLHAERANSGLRSSPNIERVDIAALVRDVVDDYRAAATEKSLAIEVQADREPILARTHSGQVQHILGNLLSNAVKYTPPHGHVRVRLASESTSSDDNQLRAGVCIEVRDSGPGVPPALRERVFDEFFRVDAASGGPEGHGVGLAISRRFARLLGGEITLADAPEGGAMFTLRLPRDIDSVAPRYTAPTVTTERSPSI